MSYRLTYFQKVKIAHNLIDFLQEGEILEQISANFIFEWIMSGCEGKTKAHYDVWDMVLKNYMPDTSPILFRSCNNFRQDGKIASFTGSIRAASRFANSKGLLLICDTSLPSLLIEGKKKEIMNTLFSACHLA